MTGFLNGYLIRYYALLPVRRIIRALAWLVARVPGTTNGERAEMGLTPCHRCMGHAIMPDVPSFREVA